MCGPPSQHSGTERPGPVRLATSEVADSRRPRSERSERTARDGYTDDEAARGATRQPSAKWPWFAGWGLGRGDQLEAAQRHNEERKGPWPVQRVMIDERSSCASDPDPAGTRRGGTTIGHVTHDDRRRSSSSSTLDRPYRRTDGETRRTYSYSICCACPLSQCLSPHMTHLS